MCPLVASKNLDINTYFPYPILLYNQSIEVLSSPFVSPLKRELRLLFAPGQRENFVSDKRREVLRGLDPSEYDK